MNKTDNPPDALPYRIGNWGLYPAKNQCKQAIGVKDKPIVYNEQQTMTEILSHIGNMDLMDRRKTAFLCSSKTTSRDILKSFDWATHVPQDSCIISGFQTKLEKDVLHFLLKRHIPVIIVLARKMYKVIPAEIQSAIDQNEALIISLSNQIRNNKEGSFRRNKYIIHVAEDVFFGALDSTSSLTQLTNG